ncbi:hypothetical protein [Rhodococcus sp. CH91]|uniref:hypothetical protein n=1 Tax=Rhodococcus sp. CH91 TaxID=2910256 RepID=UPI001F4B7191|nr:hypothetical protein [Rhodococcus sp. CH91]
MQPIDSWAPTNGFGPRVTYTPEALSVSRAPRGPRGARGIYLVEFSNGACYIGISGSNCAHRLAAHGKTYDDISAFRLQRFSGSYSALRARERELIHDAEKHGLVVRNREHALRFEGTSVFDDVVDPDEQELWLEEPSVRNALDDACTPPALPASHIEGYAHRWKRFTDRPDADELVRLVNLYLSDTVCHPHRTEAQFWSVSCLPTSNPNRLACVTLNWMETFVLFVAPSGQVRASLFVDGEELPQGRIRQALYLRRRGIHRSSITHAPGGPTQKHLIARGPEAIAAMITDPVIARAAASLNLALMRKGRSSQTRSHCAQLAQAALHSAIPDPA